MKRGELYRVASPSAKDPKKSRVFVVVSRQVLIDSRFSTVICAPIYSTHDGLSTQVMVGVDEARVLTSPLFGIEKRFGGRLPLYLNCGMRDAECGMMGTDLDGDYRCISLAILIK